LSGLGLLKLGAGVGVRRSGVREKYNISYLLLRGCYELVFSWEQGQRGFLLDRGATKFCLECPLSRPKSLGFAAMLSGRQTAKKRTKGLGSRVTFRRPAHQAHNLVNYASCAAYSACGCSPTEENRCGSNFIGPACVCSWMIGDRWRIALGRPVDHIK